MAVGDVGMRVLVNCRFRLSLGGRTLLPECHKCSGLLAWLPPMVFDRIPSTTPGAEPPRDARDSGSARSHSTHLETSSSDRPKWSPTRSSTRYQDQISVTCTRWTLRMPSFTRATHAQPSLSNFTRRDSNFGERTRSRGTTLGERKFPTSPQNKKTKLTHCSIYVPMRTISTSHAKMNVVLTLIGLPQESQNVSCWRYTPTPNRTAFRTS